MLIFHVVLMDGHIDVLYIVTARAKCGWHHYVLLPQKYSSKIAVRCSAHLMSNTMFVFDCRLAGRIS